MRLAISRVHYPVTTLGPGRRVGIWFQGCSIRCAGCVSADTWVFRDEGIEVDQLCDSLRDWLDRASGVTITGGEPFDQLEGLTELLIRVNEDFSGDVLIFTGYPWEAVGPYLHAMTGLVDAVIAGPYVSDVPQTRALRGSDNQTLHMLTAVGHELFAAYERNRSVEDDSFDLMIEADGSAWMVGIPRAGDMDRLRAAIAEAGGSVLTTQSRIRRNEK